jgi:hypothetical protein
LFYHPLADCGIFFVSPRPIFIRKQKTIAMNNNEDKNQKVAAGKVAVWNVQVAIFEPAMILSRLLPSESKYWKLKVVLN